ncbi:small basic family protein [Paraliobacillus salinarum]|uniref:small basic family protein n=1 Tax=Paraliobacillus salinarum TaxID=1158996 RepID=UPI0015F708CF|nr:small basic family protein [Paraliobacillus salinarum]
MWLPAIFLIIGISLGLLTDITISDQYSNYLSIAILAALDTLFGGIRAHLDRTFDQKIFVSGFLFNIGLAVLLTFIGVKLGIDLYLAAVFAFGVRLFQNIAIIRRRLILQKNTEKQDN